MHLLANPRETDSVPRVDMSEVGKELTDVFRFPRDCPVLRVPQHGLTNILRYD